MKNRTRYSLVIVGVSGIFLLFVAARATWLMMAREPQSQVVCTESIFNFDEINSRESIDHTFILRNTGEEPVDILEAKSGCPCTTVFPHEKTIQPGSSVPISVRFQPSGPPGVQRQVVLVKIDDSKNSKVWLHLRGTVVNENESIN